MEITVQVDPLAKTINDGRGHYLDVQYTIKFTNKEPVPIDVFAKALLAHENIIKRTGPFIKQAVPGIIISDVDVLIVKIESGSIKEDLLVRIFFGSEANYKAAIELAGNIMESNPILTGAVCVGVAAYIYFGIKRAREKEGGKTVNIDAYRSVVAQEGSTINITDEKLKEILEGVSDKITLSKQAINAVAPAHLEDEASIEMNENKNLQISPAFIKESPTIYPEHDPLQDNETKVNIQIEIWASDQENYTKGWAGTIPGIIGRRVKFTLDENVDPNKLHGKRLVNADVVIRKELKPEKKEYVPVSVEILKIYND